MIFLASLKNGCAWLLKPFRRSGRPVSLGDVSRYGIAGVDLIFLNVLAGLEND